MTKIILNEEQKDMLVKPYVYKEYENGDMIVTETVFVLKKPLNEDIRHGDMNPNISSLHTGDFFTINTPLGQRLWAHVQEVYPHVKIAQTIADGFSSHGKEAQIRSKAFTGNKRIYLSSYYFDVNLRLRVPTKGTTTNVSNTIIAPGTLRVSNHSAMPKTFSANANNPVININGKDTMFAISIVVDFGGQGFAETAAPGNVVVHVFENKPQSLKSINFSKLIMHYIDVGYGEYVNPDEFRDITNSTTPFFKKEEKSDIDTKLEKIKSDVMAKDKAKRAEKEKNAADVEALKKMPDNAVPIIIKYLSRCYKEDSYVYVEFNGEKKRARILRQNGSTLLFPVNLDKKTGKMTFIAPDGYYVFVRDNTIIGVGLSHGNYKMAIDGNSKYYVGGKIE